MKQKSNYRSPIWQIHRCDGVNFGISLSLWDYLFGTHHIPEDSGTIELGFEGDENFSKDFIGQNLYGFGAKNKLKTNLFRLS